MTADTKKLKEDLPNSWRFPDPQPFTPWPSRLYGPKSIAAIASP
jgi:hypothetical protein